METYLRLSGLGFVFCFSICISQGQQLLRFGTLKSHDNIIQARFEMDSLEKKLVFAPYGRTPVAFNDIKWTGNQLTFSWRYNNQNYGCTLFKEDQGAYTGNCTSAEGEQMNFVIRTFSEEDAKLQGNYLQGSTKDIQILDRALALLNKGINWNRSDNRVCDQSSYPYKWSLFCALHQASIDTDGEYRHLRPAIKAVRQAIEEATSGKKFAHLLQDFNNEATGFNSVQKVIHRAKEIIDDAIIKIKQR